VFWANALANMFFSLLIKKIRNSSNLVGTGMIYINRFSLKVRLVGLPLVII
jgi:hypothetical protein